MKKTAPAAGQLSAEPIELVVDQAEADQRLDIFLAIHFTDYSRGHLRRVITAGGAKVDGRGSKPAYRLHAGQRVAIVLPEIPRQSPRPENIPLDILYEDERPGGRQQAAGHGGPSGPGALVGHAGQRLAIPFRTGPEQQRRPDPAGHRPPPRSRHQRRHPRRPHRPGTSQVGDAVPEPHRSRRSILPSWPVSRTCDRDFIDRSIGVHPRQREKMAILRDDPAARSAQTFYQVQERFDGFATVQVLPEDGADAPDPRPLEPYRLPGAVRPPIRRPRARSPAARSAAIRTTAWCCWRVRPCTPGGSASSIPPAASRSRSRPLCRPIWPACWPSCGSTGDRDRD